ncbi:MAG: DUF1549 domain-containing protein, partial [Verrucomicrobia bacterium]|nr:DUF1549 domain-containing protein [Verrucomicrobiota bacterium]
MRRCFVICFSISAIAVACSDVSWAGVVSEQGKHWAFQPLAEVAVPESGEGNLIDAFVEKGLRAAGLNFSAPADRRVLVRRAYLDLTGLPPAFDEVESFVMDSSEDAFYRVVDRLLASRSYGEHWARHWLDVARYSDAKGYVDAGEPRNPFAFTYRDYVIGAFARDLGFDQFAREQIAADQLAVADASSLAALGFLTVGSRYNFFPHEIIDDRIDVVTRGFLGLTVQCARCHDHKFDPISARDYYSLYSVFANSVEPTPDLAPRIGATTGIGENEEFTKKLEDSATRHAEVREKLHQRMMHEMRAWAGDYLRYIVQSTPEHRTEPQAELRTKRGLLREFSAYAGGGMVRWRRYLESRSSNDSVWGMWQRLSATPRSEIPDRFPSLLEQWKQEAVPNEKLLAALSGAKVVSLADAANIYGEVLESTVEKWEALLVESPDATSLPDAADEQLRQVLYCDD